MKHCYSCDKTKPFSEFYTNKWSKGDGYQTLCKECKKALNRKNIGYSKAYRKKKFATDPEWRKKYSSRNEKDRVKDRARAKVQYAVKTGKLVKGICYFSDLVCGEGVTVPHHEDYSKPLDVVWMCQLHHRRYHLGELKLQSNQQFTP